MLSLERIKGDVKEKNYSEIPFPVSRKEFNEAAESFLEFLKLPQEVKDSMYLRLNLEDDGSNLGYVNRKQFKGSLDDKEYFHYHGELIDKIVSKELQQNPIISNFLSHANKIYENGLNKLYEIVEIFESEYSEITDRFFRDGVPFRGFLRFLKYDIKNQGEILAKGHYDRGTITLALAESDPGLRIGRNPESLKEINHKERSAIFMPSIGLSKITEEIFTPTWHDVVRVEGDSYGSGISRWAIVFFADAHNLKYPTKEETHTPIEN